jgi:hypothetical protein
MKLFGRSPLRSRRIPAVMLMTALLAGGCLAHARKHEPIDLSGPDASASPTPTPPKFNVPIPVSHFALGFNYLYFDDQGRPQMYFSIKKATRVDFGHMALEQAYLQSYDDKGTPDADVYMSRSSLDLNSRVVTSDVPVTVRRADFEIVGQKMSFNTQTRVGHMSGHVRMIIYNRQTASQGSPSPSPSPSPGPSATPQPSPQ